MNKSNKNKTIKAVEIKPGIVEINCHCGKPIIKSIESGMLCEDECDRVENEAAMIMGMKMIDDFCKIINVE